MTYLITGATGFLGGHLLAALARGTPAATCSGAQANFDVQHCVLVRHADDWAHCPFASKYPGVQIIVGGLHDTSVWQDDPRLQNIRGIFHLAAKVQHSRHDSAAVYATNVEGTCNMVAVAAHHGCRLVYVSTSGTVGVFNEPMASADEHATLCTAQVARWPYYDSKVQAEHKAAIQAKARGVRLVIVRPPMMLGPGDYRFRATAQIVRFLRGRLPFVVAGGMHYNDIRDAAMALLAAMLHPEPQPVYHLPGTTCSVKTFFDTLGDVAGRRAPRLQLPYAAAWSIATASTWLSRQLRRPAFFPDPVVIEMASHYWGMHSQYAAEDLQFISRPGRQTLQDMVVWIRAKRCDCGP